MPLFHGVFLSQYAKISMACTHTLDQEAGEKSRGGRWRREAESDRHADGYRVRAREMRENNRWMDK